MPILLAVIVALAVVVVVLIGMTVGLIGGHKPAGTRPAAAAASSDAASAFVAIEQACNTTDGYDVEDNGRTLILKVGGVFMNSDTMTCVFNRLGVPSAVQEHVATTRALDGQQTDSWPGYTARWTYHPDDGLQMTIQAA